MKDDAKLKRFSKEAFIILDNEKGKLEKPRFKPVSFDL